MPRSAAAFLLVLAATVVAPLVIATSWLSTHVDDRQAYLESVAPLAEDPEVRARLADEAAEAAVAALQQHVPIGLPAAVGEWARAAAQEIVQSPDFPVFWRQANARLHRDVTRLVEDPDARPQGWVTVDASPLLGQVLLSLEERGVPVALLPRTELNVPVVPESELVAVSDRYRAAKAAQPFLPVVWAGLVLLALLVARGWRGRLRALALALVGVGVAAVLLTLAVDPAVALAKTRAEEGGELAGLVAEVVLQSLASYSRGFLLAAPLGVILLGLSLRSRRREATPA